MRRRNGESLPESRRAPRFDEYVQQYLGWMEETGARKGKTISQEKSALKGWVNHIGGLRLNQIARRHINEYVQQRKSSGSRRKEGGVGNRTANLDVLALSNILKHAQDDGQLHGKLPTEGWKPLSYRAPRRPLFGMDEVDRICCAALEKNKDESPKFRNGELLADVVRFMPVWNK